MSALALARRLDAVRPVSGQALAESLGISRAAVWKRIESLRAAGLEIAAEGGRGYRLAHPVEWLRADRVLAELSPPARARLAALDIHDEVDSTMAVLARGLAAGAPSGSACLAEHQRAGRGRRGRAWASPLGANLYLSLLWRFDAGLGALAGLNLAIGVAVRDALARCGVAAARLKWPNDVIVDGRKLAGVLVEAGGQWHGPCHAVVGVGVNWRMPGVAGRAIDQPWTDVDRAGGGAIDRNLGAARVIDALLEALAAFERDGAGAFVARWHAHDALAGQAITVHEDGRRWTARALRVDAAGRLLVERDDGTTVALAAGEVSVRRRT
jgi:BirA family biotin operon repressor/biotin-[acetyl-CoA-carboxylase] ligase